VSSGRQKRGTTYRRGRRSVLLVQNDGSKCEEMSRERHATEGGPMCSCTHRRRVAITRLSKSNIASPHLHTRGEKGGEASNPYSLHQARAVGKTGLRRRNRPKRQHQAARPRTSSGPAKRRHGLRGGHLEFVTGQGCTRSLKEKKKGRGTP